MATVAAIKSQVNIEKVLSYYGRTPANGKKMQCLFPEKHTHHDTHPSMDKFEDRVFCRSQGCFSNKGADIFGVVGLMEDLTDFAAQKARVEEIFNMNGNARERTIDQVYDYMDETGTLLFQTVRYDPKDFRQRQPNGTGGWI